MLILGIDPGANTGVATFIDGKLMNLRTVDPEEIPDVIRLSEPARVVFEDSRLQSHVWIKAKTVAARMKAARNVGEVDAWCKLIVAACGWHGITAHSVSPRNKGAKLDAERFKVATGWTGKSNQHERDAAMVAYPYRNSK